MWLRDITSGGYAERRCRVQASERPVAGPPWGSRCDATMFASSGGPPIAPAMPGDLQDAAGEAPAVRRARSSTVRRKLRHSPVVGVSSVPVEPAPQELQREQSLDRALHVVTS